MRSDLGHYLSRHNCYSCVCVNDVWPTAVYVCRFITATFLVEAEAMANAVITHNEQKPVTVNDSEVRCL